MDEITKLQIYFAAQEDVLLAYLFGSRAAGRAAPESDYDFAVLTSQAMPPERRYQMASEVARLLSGAPVDLVSLRRAPVELAYAVVAEGRRLFERDLATRVEFEADVLSRYGDIVHILREQRADLVRGGSYEAGVRRNRAALDKTSRVLAEMRAATRQNTR
jgi:predicted nucleotidyltransferase